MKIWDVASSTLYGAVVFLVAAFVFFRTWYGSNCFSTLRSPLSNYAFYLASLRWFAFTFIDTSKLFSCYAIPNTFLSSGLWLESPLFYLLKPVDFCFRI